jgi:cytochrome c-type biogenesis protein CcmH
MTWVLWYGPYVLLGIGILVVVLISRHRGYRVRGQDDYPVESRQGTAPEVSSSLNAEEAERLKKLLQRDSDT